MTTPLDESRPERVPIVRRYPPYTPIPPPEEEPEPVPEEPVPPARRRTGNREMKEA